MITCFGGDGSLFKERTCVTPPSSCKGVVSGDEREGGAALYTTSKAENARKRGGGLP